MSTLSNVIFEICTLSLMTYYVHEIFRMLNVFARHSDSKEKHVSLTLIMLQKISKIPNCGTEYAELLSRGMSKNRGEGHRILINYQVNEKNFASAFTH